MIPDSAILVVSGMACLGLSGLLMYLCMPREGRPAPSWISTEFRGMSVAMGVIIFLMAGIVLVTKAIL